MALCPGLPGSAGTRRNIHPLTPFLLINISRRASGGRLTRLALRLNHSNTTTMHCTECVRGRMFESFVYDTTQDSSMIPTDITALSSRTSRTQNSRIFQAKVEALFSTCRTKISAHLQIFHNPTHTHGDVTHLALGSK